MTAKDGGRQLNVASAAHGQVFYDHIDANKEPRGINGPLFTRTTLVGGEKVEKAWQGAPLGLNVRVPTPVRKGDLVRANVHYRSKHDPKMPPTNSTLGRGQGWTGGVRNVDGDYAPEPDELPGGTKTVGILGKTLGSYKADPTKFLRSYEKHPPLAYPTRFVYTDVAEPRPRPPHRHEIPPPKIPTKTDFVTKNQVDAIVKGNKALGGYGLGDKVKNLVQQDGSDFGSWDSIIEAETKKSKTMNASKASKGGTAASIEAMQLEAARRADIEAIVKGKPLDGHDRQKRIKTIKRLAAKVNRAQSTTPTPAKAAVVVPPRAATAMSNYVGEEGMMTGRSAAPSEYLDDNGHIVTRMPEEVRRQMIRALKRRWDEVNKEYQLLNLSLFNLDTVHKVNKKEACEAMMARIEKDVYKLSKGTVFVQSQEAHAATSRPHSVAR